MALLSEIASVNVTSESAAVTLPGFGIPLVLSANATFTERVRSYSDLTGLAADFATTTVEYQAIAEAFAQSPRPDVVYVGRRANKPTQRFAVTPVVANSTVYKLKIRSAAGADAEVSYTSDGSATATEIIGGLKTAIDALSLSVTVSDQTTYMRIVANSPGAWFSVESTTSPIENLTVAQDHADPGLAADLDAILTANADWYLILSLYNSTAEVTGIATWAESNKKLFVAQTQETSVISVASGSDTTSVAYSLKNSARVRTGLLYHPSTGAFLDCALAGKCLPKTPGSETWALKQLTLTAGATSLTSTHLTNLKAKRCGYFTTVGGLNVTFEGKVSSGDYLDNVRGRDWLEANMQAGIVSLLASQDKVPYTDAGIAAIRGVVDSVIKQGIVNGLVASNPAPLVTVPKAASVPSGDKSTRTLNNVKFSLTLAGAIQKVAVSGSASI